MRIHANVRSWSTLTVTKFMASLTALLLTVTVLTGGMAGAATTINSPDYRMPILDPSSQTNAWTNVAPNALADYFTYVPYKNADAVALGFPASCGNPNAAGATTADLASTDDCYTITVKKFQQGLSLPAAWGFGGTGLLDGNGIPFGDTTWAHGYGSGGQNWTPPGATTVVTGNAPALFATPNAGLGIAGNGIWHWPAPTVKATKGRPVRIQWLNELPNEKPTGFDPTICENLVADCYPYNRIVTHVHGAHVGPESDGFPSSWYTPLFAQKGSTWESTAKYGPEGTYYYPMDQEAGTIWYHDHSLGLTHNNTNMGMAGFFPITDDNEKYLQGMTVPAASLPPGFNGINPGVKYLPTGNQELGFALQDRIFYSDGQQAMPDAPVIDAATTATCTYTMNPATGDITPNPGAVCAPLFMKAPDGHLVPHDGSVAQAYLATSTTLEFFGNIPVVNGITYAKYNVDKGVYRMRFIGGTDSRTWALRLKVANTAKYLPFWVIGTEQGLLNNPVKSEQLVIMPGERYDVLVDFNTAETLLTDGVTSGGPLNFVANQNIILENWAGDGPYGGETILPVSDPAAAAFRSVDIPEVMVFVVSGNPVASDVPAPTTALGLRPLLTAVTTTPKTSLPAANVVRKVSLIETMDMLGRILPTIDNRSFMMGSITELPKLNETEVWEIINTTMDAHPMHLHQVAFQLIEREGIALNPDMSYQFTPPDVVPGSPPNYVGDGVIDPILPHEVGWKDTIMCPPGKITRVKTTFDIPGVYVWHCHILSHEEHDMMRPMVITTPATGVTLTSSTPANSQPSGATVPVTFTARATTGIAAYPDGSGFEYQFSVTGPNPIAPVMPAMYTGSVAGYSMASEAAWTPPTTPGTYTITVNAKAIGPVSATNPVKTATLDYIVAAPAISGVTTTTATGAYGAGTVIPITVNFNQPVTSAAGLTLTLNNGAVINTGAINNATTFTGTYTVAAGENTISLNVASISGSIADTANNTVTNPVVPAGVNLASTKPIVINTPLIHPEYTKPILDPKLQPHWVTGIPNALADYFTFTPYATDAAAVAAGFPTGVCGTGPTQEDCYTVSVRQFQQNLGLVAPGTYIPGVSAGTPLSTMVWGYGSATNAPAVGPFTAGVWHFPAPTFQNRSNRPARITWANELPNVAPAGFDPSYDCGPNAPDCYPYNRIVTHVHGAHVADDSDGLTTAWYTPLDPATGMPILVGPDYEPSKYGPPGTYRYENTQEAATVWYHDHAMGTTHTNTNQGMAGFFPITDANEDALRGITNPASKVLPTGDYEVGFALQDRTFWPDGSLAMPDTPVYNMMADSVNCSIDVNGVINVACPAVAFSKDALGALIPYSPAAPTPGPFTASGRVFAACTPDLVNGGVFPETCPEVPFSKAADGHLIAYSPTAPVPGPFTASSGTLEYFGNVPVVNGVAFGTYSVEPRMYRMRFIGGTDSRTFIMQLQERGSGKIIPFWQIGTEQGFLNNPVLRNMITLLPGERVDVLVDFSSLTIAGTKVVMANLGPDMPYGGVYVPADRSVDIPEIMEFVSLGTAGLSAVPEVTVKPVVPAAPNNVDGYPDLNIALRPAGTLIASTNLTPTVGTPVRKVSLIEITDQYGRTMPTIDSRGFMPAMVPITEVIKLGDTEQWDIINTTVDSHPMHLHQVAFQLIDRIDLPATVDPVTGLATGFVPPVTNTMTNTFTQPSYTPAALDPITGLPVTIPPAAWEQGWKDTIECPPGKVTRVKAKFDIPGYYVWHCHILSHEEHDMMRPMVVVTPLTPASTVTLTSSAPGNTQPATPAAPVTFSAAALTGIAGYSDPMSFEYQFTVTPPAGVAVTQPALPPTRMTMIAGSTPGYSMIRQAVWTPPTVPGTYVVTVKAKAIGAADIAANIGTGTLTYTVAPPAVASVTAATAAGALAIGTVVPITVTFNQPVSTTGLTLTLNNGAVINTGILTNAATFTGNYTVAAGQNTPVGQSLSIAATTGTITDAAGNAITNPAIPAVANISNVNVTTLDPTVPSIAVTTPQTVNTATATITGTATPPALGTIQTVAVTLNGAPVATTVAANGVFTAPATLVAGTNLIAITATDTTLKQSTIIQNITFDPAATMIAVTTPPLVNTATTTITGTVAPPAANTVTIVTVAVNNGGAGTATIGAGGTFSAPVILTPGANTITITTTDSALKQSVVVQNITFDPAATLIAVTTPPLANTAAATITGTATPPAASTVTTVTVTVNNGAPVTATVGAGGTFSAPVTLAAGNNTVTVTVTDNAVPPRVNTTTSTIVLNTTATVIAVTTPPLVNSAATTITGTATPPAASTVTTVTVTVNNGAPVTATIGAGGAFSAPVTLTAGNNTITITTTDSALKQSVVVQNITFDPTATMITVTTPPLVNTTTTPVTGTATPGVNGIGSVTVNGTPVTLGPAGDFNIPVVLNPGSNIITIVVTDTTGKLTKQEYTVILGDTLPPVTTATPASGTYNGAISVVLASGLNTHIYYTTNNVTPTVATAQLYNGPISIPATATLMFFAVDQAGKQEAVQSRTYTIASSDLTGSVRINNGALYTNSATVNLNLAASDPLGVQQYMISNDGVTYQTVAINPANASFNATISWQLTPGDGLKTVYVKYVDTPVPNNVYGPFVAQITLDTIPPVSAATPVSGTYNGAINVVLSSEPGANIYYTTTGATPTVSPALLYNSPITISANTTLKYFAVDLAGNQETVHSSAYSIASSDLSGTVAIDNGDHFTKSTTVTLSLSASDPFGVKQYMISNDGISYQTFNTPNPASPTFSTTVNWTLLPGEGQKTVFVKYVDTPTPNNVYGPFTAQITLDSTPPVTTATPASGTYNGSIMVVLASEPGASIYYTTDGTVPTINPALRYVGPVMLPATYTVRFFAVDQAGNQEAVQSRTYTIASNDLSGSVKINNGALFTSNTFVTLTLSATDPFGVGKYMVSNDDITYQTVTITTPAPTFNATVPWNLTPGNGQKTVYVKYVDTPTPNNVYGPFTAQITLDTIPPVTTATPASGTYNGAINVVLSTEQNANIYYTINGTTPTVSPDLLYGGPITISANATLKYFAVDQAGNQEAVQTKVYTIASSDLSGSVTINNGSNYTNNANVTLTLSATDPFGVKQYMVSNDGISYVTYNITNSANTTFSASVPWTLTPGDGLKTVFVKYVDTPTPSNVYGPFTAQITLGTTPPVTAATPASGSYNGAISAVLTSDQNARIYYTTDGSMPTIAPANVYSGPITISSNTTLKYFAVDLAGNQEAVQSRTYTIAGLDLTGSVTINSGALFTTSANATLSLSANDPLGVSKYMISNDDITYQTFDISNPAATFSASIPWTLTQGNGLKTVYVKYVDTPTPNNIYGPYVAQITVDNVAPAITLNSPPNGADVNTPTIQVSGVVTETVGIKSFTVNGNAVPVVSGEFTTTLNLTNGLNTITVVATDQAGSAHSVVHTVTLDTVVPVTSVSPASGSYSSAITVTLTTSKPSAVIRYTTDGTAPNASSQVYTGPFVLNAQTTTTFNVRYFAADPAGNVEAAQSIAYTIHVTDLTNASVTINNGAKFTKSPNVTLALAATDPNGVPQMQVACDGINFGTVEAFAATRACTLATGDGLKTVAVKYIDGAGTIYDPVIAQITLDTVMPVTSATPAAGTYGGSVSVALSASKQAKIYYTTNGTVPTTSSALYTAPILLSSSATTPIALKFFAVDQAGNSEAIQTLTYTLHTSDLSQAAVSINNGAKYTNNTTVTLALAASDSQGIPKMQVACDGVNFGADEPFASTRTCVLSAGDGLKTVAVKFIDGLGTVYEPIPAQITLDTIAPVITPVPVAGTYENSLGIQLSADEIATIYFTTDGTLPTQSPANLYTGPITLAPSATTTYQVRYFAVDQAGNSSAIQSSTYNVHLSDLVGSIKINGGAPITATTDVTLTLSADDPAGVTQMQFSNDGVNYTALEAYATGKSWLLNPGDGLKTVYVRFKDGAGFLYTFTANIIVAAAAATPSVGDLNGDNVVDIKDALRALQINIGLFTATTEEMVRGDVAPLVNGVPKPDGIIDIADSLLILRRTVGMVTW